jgi:hypothetical protein
VRNFAGWIVVRTILVADVVLLVVAGFMALIWVEHPAGILAAAAIWMVAGGLLGLLPLTDRYRAEQRWYRKNHPEMASDPRAPAAAACQLPINPQKGRLPKRVGRPFHHKAKAGSGT